MFVELLVWNILRTRLTGTSSPTIHAQNHIFLHNCFFHKLHWKFYTRASNCSFALTLLRHHILSSLRIAVALFSLPQWFPYVFTSNHGTQLWRHVQLSIHEFLSSYMQLAYCTSMLGQLHVRGQLAYLVNFAMTGIITKSLYALNCIRTYTCMQLLITQFVKKR